ncbi:hypothetical protein QPK87_10750 [Kamptonema cortianum]|nr:hypothetical protein [Geitlerinema splendidum]MDK3157052.1 hypothetical protein [Kamptonema cortianum]
MEIRDYETGKRLHDVDLVLSVEEAEELHAYLSRLIARPDMRSVQISQVDGWWLDSEFSISLQNPAS